VVAEQVYEQASWERPRRQAAQVLSGITKTKLGKDAFISHKVSNLLPIILASLTVRMDWLTKVSKILKINSCFQYVPSLEVRRK
jgi:hypothetical protein